MRHGFKAQCERRAVELRKKFGLPPESGLSAAAVAADRGVTVWSTEDVPGVAKKDIDQLTIADPSSWSGFTMLIAGRHLVLINPAQSLARRNSVTMHELAHIELGHALTNAGITADGMLVPGTFNREQEDEADWLAGAMLLPRPALLWMRRRKLSDDDASDHFSVSMEMLKWRIRMTGIDVQIRRMGS